jgi:hypothetical protein
MGKRTKGKRMNGRTSEGMKGRTNKKIFHPSVLWVTWRRIQGLHRFSSGNVPFLNTTLNLGLSAPAARLFSIQAIIEIIDFVRG